MQFHQLSPAHKRKKGKRVGRGGKRGTYSGRGLKGQKARAGTRFKPIIRELIKRYPKKRGYRFKAPDSRVVTVNLAILEKKFEEGKIVSPMTLMEKKIIRNIKGRIPKVKILAKGEISKPLKIQNCLLSKSAKERIEKVGGAID